MKKIAIFVSGGGSNFKAIYEKIISGDIPAEISLVVSNNPNCGAITFAEKNAVPTLIINKTRYPDSDTQNILLKKNLLNADINLICLAGYMKMIPKNIVAHFENCILNVHPALLPDFGGKGFYGMKVHELVLQSNVSESGATVHFVDNKYDHGPIIAQQKVKILETDNAEILAERVLKAEHNLYPEVVKAFCENRINWGNGLPEIVK
jgi:formyltetrahydrofolate-dependent phosphoribosylglycinamide formyltransferase